MRYKLKVNLSAAESNGKWEILANSVNDIVAYSVDSLKKNC